MKDKKSWIMGSAIGLLAVALVCETVVLMDYRNEAVATAKQLTTLESEVEETPLTNKINGIRQLMDQYYLYDDIDENLIRERLLKGMLWGLDDVYSTYYTAEEMEAINQDTTAEYSGIGAVLTIDAEYGIGTVVKTYEGSPSAEAGMLPGDYIVEVNGEDVSGMDLSTIVTKIKGEEGTPVQIKVLRESIDDYVTFDMERRRVEIPSVAGEMLEDGIGYVMIESWDMLTAAQFAETFNELGAQGMQGLVVDIRNNPGGLVQAACDVVDIFVKDGGKLVYTVDKNGNERDYIAQDRQDVDIPMVVLVNGHSASSSEIFAGGIRDYGVGTLIGEKTFGKGIVQNIIDIGDGEAIKMTVAEYYLPSGVCIHGEGVEPDIEEPLDEKLAEQPTVTHEEDNQLQKALEVLKGKMTE